MEWEHIGFCGSLPHYCAGVGAVEVQNKKNPDLICWTGHPASDYDDLEVIECAEIDHGVGINCFRIKVDPSVTFRSVSNEKRENTSPPVLQKSVGRDHPRKRIWRRLQLLEITPGFSVQ